MKIKKSMTVLLISVVSVLIFLAVVAMNLNSLSPLVAPQLKKLVSDYAHAEIDFTNLNFSLWPSARIEISNLKLLSLEKKATPNASGIPLEELTIGSLVLKVSYWKLLGGQLDVEEIAIKRGFLPLRKTTEGEILLGHWPTAEKKSNSTGLPTNESSVAQQSTTSQPETISQNISSVNTTNSSPISATSANLSFQIGLVRIEDLNLSWLDLSKGSTTPLEILNIKGKIDNISLPLYAEVSLSGSFLSPTKQNFFLDGAIGSPLANRPLSLKMRLDKAPIEEILSIAKLYSRQLPEYSASGLADIELLAKAEGGTWTATTDFSLEKGTLVVGDIFSKTNPETELAAHLSIKGSLLTRSIEATSSLSIAGEHLNIGIILPDKSSNSSWQLQIDRLNLEQISTVLPVLGSWAPQGHLTAKLSGVFPIHKQFVAPSGRISLSEVSFLTPLLNENADGERTRVEQMTGEIGLSQDSISIQPLRFKMGSTELVISAQHFQPPSGDIALTAKSTLLKIQDIAKTLGYKFPSYDKTELQQLELGIKTENGISGDMAIDINATVDDVKGLALNLGKVVGIANIDRSTVRIKRLTSRIADGDIEASGEWRRNANHPYSLHLQATGQNLKTLLEPFTSKVEIVGTLKSANVSLAGNTTDLKPSSKGKIDLVAEDGAIQGVNILGSTLGKVASLPLIGNTILKVIPPDKLPLIEGNSSPFDQIILKIGIANNSAQIEAATLEHSSYAVHAHGSITLDGDGELKGKLLLKPSLSALAIVKEPRLKLLLDQDGNMIFPVTIKRSDARIVVLPDTKDIASRAARNSTADTVGKLLNRLGTGKKSLF